MADLGYVYGLGYSYGSRVGEHASGGGGVRGFLYLGAWLVVVRKSVKGRAGR